MGMAFYNIFQSMSSFKAENLGRLLALPERLHEEIERLVIEIENASIEWIFGFLQEIAKTLKSQCQPIRKVNALVVLLRCMQKGSPVLVLLAEIYIVPSFLKAIQFLLANRDFPSLTSFFQRQNYPLTIPHIQNLSYNFLTLVCSTLSTGAAIKPLRVYQGQEYEEPSLYKKYLDRLAREGINLGLRGKNQCLPFGQLYLSLLARSQEQEDELIYFFMDMLEKYLLAENAENNQLFFQILQYGESNVTGQTIARLIDIVSYHSEFEIRLRALKLFDRMILWGDVEALLVVNFTENVEGIIKALWKVRGEVALEEGRHIYAEIEHQQHKKLQFYKLFLVCLQNWAISFPNHEFLVLSKSSNDPSPIYQMYKLLRDKKKTIFPANPNLVKYQTQSRLAFLQKQLRNRLILKDLSSESRQKQTHSSYIREERGWSLSDLNDEYQQHKQLLIQLITKKIQIRQCMEKLRHFQAHFEEKVECLSVEEGAGEQVDCLIEKGLELVEIIALIGQPYQQLLRGAVSEEECEEEVVSICLNYFSPSENKLMQFYSERVAHRKEALVGLLRRQRSAPLEKELQCIHNSAILQQFRENYRGRLERGSSSRQSEQSEMNLEIFTRNKFSRESRDEMEKPLQERDSSSFLTPTKPELELLRAKHNLVTTTPNSLTSSREKKKLTLLSKHPLPPDKVQNENTLVSDFIKKVKNENSSETRSSREHQSQKVTKVVSTEVSYYENSHYFYYMPNQSYKHSYIHPRILVFKSPFLTIERLVKPPDAHNKVRMQFLLTPHRDISQLHHYIEDQECIRIEQVGASLPAVLQANGQYCVEVEGEMRKVPLRMPIIAFFVGSTIIFEYILPFTLNFFLTHSPPKEALQVFSKGQLEAKYRYSSQRLILSKALFPQPSLATLANYLPGCLPHDAPSGRERYLWHVQIASLAFMLVFQLHLEGRVLTIGGYDTSRSDEYNVSMIKYSINFLAHLFAERLA